jgi:drug/metabolite transporter (DMT)-like permease
MFSLEPVFAGIFSFVFLKEALKPKDIIGSILILIAMWLAIKSNMSKNNHSKI